MHDTQHAEAVAAERISIGRTHLRLGKSADTAFYGELTMRLQCDVAWDQPTCATDGRRLIYNPEFVNSLTLERLLGVLCHEVRHCAQQHLTRFQPGMDHARANIAMDLAINDDILASGLELPEEACFAKNYKLPPDLAFEEYYQLLPKENETGQGQGQGQGQGPPSLDPGGCGAVIRPSQDPAQQRQTEHDWDRYVISAIDAAKGRGKFSNNLQRLLGELTKPKVNWKDVLANFLRSHVKENLSWSRVNRRTVHRGIYFPGLYSTALSDIVVSLDTSGSISKEQLTECVSEVLSLATLCKGAVTILYHNNRVYDRQNWEPMQGPLVMKKFRSGGTDHRCVFEAISETGTVPTCAICFTDLESTFPRTAPEYPVLWGAVKGSNPAPWGQVVRIS